MTRTLLSEADSAQQLTSSSPSLQLAFGPICKLVNFEVTRGLTGEACGQSNVNPTLSGQDC
jgi:hypothetical protein